MASQPQNLQLDRPRLLLTETRPLQKWIFYAVLLALGGLGAWGCLITAFQLPVSPAPLVGAGVFSCAFALWRQVDTRRRWWSASLLGWALWLLALVFLFEQAFRGAVHTVNTMLDFYSNKLNYDLPVLILSQTPGQPRPDPKEACTVFFSLALFPFFWAMSHMMVRRRSALGPFCLTGLLLVFPLSFSILPDRWALGVLLLFWSALLLVSSLLQGREGLLGHRERYKASGAAAARPGTLLFLPLLALCMLGLYWLNPPEDYSRPRLVDDLRVFVEEGVGAGAYLQGGQGNSNRQVRLNKLGSRSYTGETVLRVRFDWTQDGPYYRDQAKEYLKSFTGSVYTGDSWERLPLDAREELSQLELVPQNQQAAYRQNAFSESNDSCARYTLSVENLGANPRCVFTPCGLTSTPEELAPQDLEFVDDGFVKSSNFLTGTREYTLESMGQGQAVNYYGRVVNIPYPFNPSLGRASQGGGTDSTYFSLAPVNGGLMDPQAWEIWNDFVSELQAQAQAGGPGWQPDLWTLPAQLRERYLSGEEYPAESFFANMEAYTRFVYQYYTQVPEELAEFLDRYREAFGLDPASPGGDLAGLLTLDGASVRTQDASGRSGFQNRDGPVRFAQRIAETFSKFYRYSLDPPAPRDGGDFVEFFLDQSHEGYCVHFASAAVLLLRSAGYPARYAEGYAVPCPDGLWTDVPDYNAHAWVEVYCGGTGWVPVEVTPASTDNPAAYYDAALPPEPEAHTLPPDAEEARPTLPPREHKPMEREDALPDFSPRSSPTPAPQTGPGSGTGPGGSRLWLAVLGGAALLAAAAGLLWLNRGLRRSRWTKALAQPDRSRAALGAYALLLKLYGWEAFCGRREEPPQRWKELAEKARYSKNMVTEEELRELTQAAEKLRGKLREQLPPWQKARCWLAGLI